MLQKCYKVNRGDYIFITNEQVYTLKRYIVEHKTLWIGDNVKTEKHSFRADSKKKLINLINKHYEKS